MTNVRIELGSWADPYDRSGHGTITFQPNKVVIRGAQVSTPEPQTFDIPPGGTVIDVAVTRPGEYYRVQGKNYATNSAWSEAIIVLYSTLDEVPYGDLHRVDPHRPTLTPEPNPRWHAEVEALRQGVRGPQGESAYDIAVRHGFDDDEQTFQQRLIAYERAEAAADRAEEYAGSSEAAASSAEAAGLSEQQAADSATSAGLSADAAETSASEADSSALLAGSRRDQSEAARDEAVAARDETLAHGIEVSTTAGTKVTVGGHVVSYDSGARRLDSAVIGGNGWTNGEVHLVRTGNVVTVNAENFNRASAGEGWVTLFVLPAGFRPTGTRRAWVTTFRGRPIQVWADGRFQINAPVALSDNGGLTFIDVTDPPNTLPGTPA